MLGVPGEKSQRDEMYIATHDRLELGAHLWAKERNMSLLAELEK
jgi:hypothetical protein